MSTSDNLATIRRLFNALNKLDVAVLDELCTPDYSLHFPGAPGPLPREAAKHFFGMFFAAFGDIQHDLEDMLAEDDKVSVRLTVHGTHTGAFQGMPPTGKPISIGSINLFHLRDGKVAEQWVQTDTLGMLQQLGAMPAPEPATA